MVCMCVNIFIIFGGVTSAYAFTRLRLHARTDLRGAQRELGLRRVADADAQTPHLSNNGVSTSTDPPPYSIYYTYTDHRPPSVVGSPLARLCGVWPTAGQGRRGVVVA